MPLNRLVAFVLGPIITLASGYISLFLSKNIPGLHVTQKGVAGAITTALLTVVPMILAHAKVQKWLQGWQDWEKRTDDATNGALDEGFKLFLERLAAKTGVPLPTGEVLPPEAADEDVVGAEMGAGGAEQPQEATAAVAATAGPPPPVPPAAQPGAFPPADRP